MGHEHRIWIEGVARRLRGPVWAGIFILSAVAYGVYLAVTSMAGVPAGDFGLLSFVPLVLVTLATPVYVRRRMTSLEMYALTMVEDRKSATEQIPRLSSLAPVAALSVVVFASFVVPYVIDPSIGGDAPLEVLAPLPWLFPVFLVATAIWTWAYSMLGIYRIGKLPMTLRPFPRDRTPGLKPFASACVALTAVYYVFAAMVILSDLQSAGLRPFFLARDLVLIFAGIGLFFLPMLSIHRRLVQEKSKEFSWICDRYTRVLEKIRSLRDAPLDAVTQGELLSIDKIQRDILSIRSWPFDFGSLAKVLTIVLSRTAIVLSRLIAQWLGI